MSEDGDSSSAKFSSVEDELQSKFRSHQNLESVEDLRGLYSSSFDLDDESLDARNKRQRKNASTK